MYSLPTRVTLAAFTIASAASTDPIRPRVSMRPNASLLITRGAPTPLGVLAGPQTPLGVLAGPQPRSAYSRGPNPARRTRGAPTPLGVLAGPQPRSAYS